MFAVGQYSSRSYNSLRLSSRPNHSRTVAQASWPLCRLPSTNGTFWYGTRIDKTSSLRRKLGDSRGLARLEAEAPRTGKKRIKCERHHSLKSYVGIKYRYVG